MTRARTVLCVDDNPALNDNLREVLEDAGYVVRTAETVRAAETVAKDGFDVALVDVRLPDGDGLALAGRLRAIVPDAQVIMLTGFATVEYAVAAVRAGAWAFLMKPCSMPELLVTVEQAVRQLEHTEEKRVLARRAQVAEKLAAVGTLTAGVSHEIKNPLNSAALQLAVVERRAAKLPPDLRASILQPLGLVKDEITRLNAVLEEFLDFARPRELHATPVDVGALVGRVLAVLAPEAERRGVRVESPAGDRVVLSGDEPRLQQVLMNLVLNAIQATPEGGVVTLALDETPRTVSVSVDDSGPGIGDELRPRLFEPFFTTKERGTGLGLPIVHNIVEQHGGTIVVERGRHGGARFVVTLPR